MPKLTYRVEFEIQPVGQCIATLREYPDFSICGADFNAMMHRVQTELPEFLYLMACKRKTFVAPFENTDKDPPIPGKIIYYICINAPDMLGPTYSSNVHMTKNQYERIDDIVARHPYFQSRSHFLAWAAMRAVDGLLGTFLEDLNEFTSGSFDRSNLQHHFGSDCLVPDDVSVMEFQGHYRSTK